MAFCIINRGPGRAVDHDRRLEQAEGRGDGASLGDVDARAINAHHDGAALSEDPDELRAQLAQRAGDEYPHYLIAAFAFRGRHQASFWRYHATVSARPSSKVCVGA